MKTIINKIFILSVLALGFASCEKEEVQAVLMPGDAPALSVSETTLVLTEETAEEAATDFAWTASDFGYDAAVQYALQFDVEGNDFASAQSIAMGTKLDTTLTVKTLNAVATQLDLEPEVEHMVEVRVVAQVYDPAGPSAQVEPLYSNSTALSLTPYSVEVVYPAVYVPGDYQGWDPATATTLISVEDNGIYQGYVTFLAGKTLEFKVTTEPTWNSGTHYGSGGEGILSTDGGNLSVPAAGTYLITVNTNDLTWTAVPGGWGIIGDATTGGWDADTDMTYYREEGVWKITTDLTAGSLKFRFDNDWAKNYGDSNPGNDALDAGGDNIAIAEAGTYEIILNLSDENNPTYSITKAE